MASPGGRPARAANAATAGATSARIWPATAMPSRTRAGMALRGGAGGAGGFRLEALQRVRLSEHDELVARAHHGLRLGIELHLAVLPLDADDDDAVFLPQV